MELASRISDTYNSGLYNDYYDEDEYYYDEDYEDGVSNIFNSVEELFSGGFTSYYLQDLA